MLITITNSGLTNGRPTQIGSNTISCDYQGTYTFTLADFTTGTSPVYSDPENDALSYNGTEISADQIVSSGELSSGNLIYHSLAFGSTDGYEGVFDFDAADTGSNSLSGLDTGIITMSIVSKVNLAPDSVGDNSFVSNYGSTKVFSSAFFTTETTPAYNDPEGDSAYKIRIDTLPADGTLRYNGSDVYASQEILLTEVDAGYLSYVPDNAITILQSGLSFTFSISDSVNQGFTS
jgi:hypothetical protein